MKTGKCPKCASESVLPRIPLLDRGHYNSQNTLSVILWENPFARLFKHPRTFGISAWICGSCGYTELYTENLKELNETYQRAVASSQNNTQAKRKRGEV